VDFIFAMQFDGMWNIKVKREQTRYRDTANLCNRDRYTHNIGCSVIGVSSKFFCWSRILNRISSAFDVKYFDAIVF